MHWLKSILPLLILGSICYSQTCDSTLKYTYDSAAGFDPDAEGLNGKISAGPCTDAARYVVDFENVDPENVEVELTGPIVVKPETGVPTTIQFTSNNKNRKLVLTRKSDTGNNLVLDINAPYITVSNAWIIQKSSIATQPALLIQSGADSVTIQNCHFEIQKAGGLGIQVNAAKTTISQCYFRKYPNVTGTSARPMAIDIKAGAADMVIQSCLFYGTGLTIDNAGITIQANTFVGSLGDSNRVINMTNIDTKPFTIWHNLFAMEAYTIEPIQVEGGQSAVSATQKIHENAYNYPVTAVVTTSFSGDKLNNIQLPKGLSNYSQGDYPLSQMRDSLILDPYAGNFGKVPRMYQSFTPLISQIKSLTPSFNPQGASNFIWADGMLVGCFGSFDDISIYHPSPVASLSFEVQQKKPTVKKTKIVYDTAYYAGIKLPEEVFWFFGSSPEALAGGDSASLAPGNYWEGRIYGNNGITISLPPIPDSILTVPIELRTGAPIYLKMAHRTQYGWAPTSPNALDTLNGVAEYPVSDFTLTIKPNNETNHQVGNVVLFYSKNGGEEVKSVQILAISETEGKIKENSINGSDLDLGLKPVEFLNLPKGKIKFQAFPIGINDVVGKDTIKTSTVNLRALTDSTAYFKPTEACSSGTGVKDSPFCNMAEVKEWYDSLKSDQATIITMTGADTLRYPLATLGGAKHVNLIAEPYREAGIEKQNPRPVIKGLSINRPNITVKGFILETPADTPAVTITKGDVTLEGNFIISSIPKALVTILSTDSTQTITFKNNLFYGGSRALQIQSPAKLQIIHNSFVYVEEANTIAIALDGLTPTPPSGFSAIIANNHFTGIGQPGQDKPYKHPFLIPAGSNLEAGITMVRNVFSASLDTSALMGVVRLDTLLDYSRSVRDVNPYEFSLDRIQLSFGEAMASSLNRASPLFAGSNPIYSVKQDIWGNDRVKKPEVGAFENLTDKDYSSFRAFVQTVEKKSDSLSFTFTSKNFEPKLTPAVFIWWLPGKLSEQSTPVPFNDSAILKLTTEDIESGVPKAINYIGGINGLGSSGGKWFTVCFGFNNEAGDKPVKFLCKEQITGTPTSTAACENPAEGKKCPAGKIWRIDDPGFQNSTLEVELKYISSDVRILATGGPITDDIRATVPNLILNSPLPYIIIDTPLTFKATEPDKDADNFYTLTVNFGKQVEFTGLELFRQDLADNKVYFVSSWSHTDSGLSQAIIESRKPGRFLFAWTNPDAASPTLQPLKPGGFYKSGVSAATLEYNSTAAITANPVIMITPVPAGANMKDEVFDENYFAKTHIISTGLSSMGPDLQKRQLVSLYKKLKASFPTIKAPADFGKIPINLPGSDSKFLENITVKQASADNRFQFDMGEYKKSYTKRKITRSIEFIFTVFDAGKMSMSHTFWPTEFTSNLEIGESSQYDNSDLIKLKTKTWELFSYPWAESNITKSSLYFVLGLDKPQDWKKNRHRMFKSQGNTAFGIEKWREYKGVDPMEISIDSGRAVWVATYGPQGSDTEFLLPKSKGGQSLDGQTFNLALIANQWNDFGLPYNFPMKLQDILKASTLPPNTVFFQFKPLYQKNGSPAYDTLNEASTLYPWRGYTVKPAANSSLVFPIIDYKRSLYAEPTLKKSAQKGYVVKILAQNETGISQLTVGKSAGSKSIGEAPRLPLQNFAIFLTRQGASQNTGVYSGLSSPLSKGLQGAWPLQTEFRKKPASITFSLREARNLPDSLNVYLVNPLDSRINELAAGKNLTLPASVLESGAYHIVTGTKAFAQSLMSNNFLGLANFPNPFSNRTEFLFTLPTAIAGSQSLQYRLKLVGLNGSTVYSATGRFAPGRKKAVYDWDGKNHQGQSVPAGHYLAILNVRLGEKTLTAKRRVVKLR